MMGNLINYKEYSNRYDISEYYVDIVIWHKRRIYTYVFIGA